MKKTTDNPRPFAVMMTDEEFAEYHESQKKEALLNELLRASNKSFSVKNLKRDESDENTKPTVKGNGSLSEPPDPFQSEGLVISDDEWNAILERGSNFQPSPIDDITRSELGTFHLEDSFVEDPSSFDRMFKKEQSMLAELMKDVTEQARAANNKLKDMAKKSSGYGGVSKTYPDLLSAANSLNTTRLNIVKQMADLKKTIADLNFKKAKELGPDDANKDNEIADGFFNKILGNRKEFIDAAMSGLHQQDSMMPYPYPAPSANTNNEIQSLPTTDDARLVNESNDSIGNRPTRSITSPLMGYQGDYYDEEQPGGDPYGYIRNEDRDVSICVQRFQDGRVEFVAVDKDGDWVDDYELPADDLLLSLEFRVGSQFATDEEGRRYRIIDVDPNGVDISDILDDDE